MTCWSSVSVTETAEDSSVAYAKLDAKNVGKNAKHRASVALRFLFLMGYHLVIRGSQNVFLYYYTGVYEN